MAYDLEEVTRRVQVQALSMAVTKLLARHLASGGNTEEAARQWLNLTELESDEMKFEGLPPEWSDLAAQEYRDSAIRLGLRARALATGQPLDPEDFQKSWRLA